jgi:acetoin utilization deacetylase AcuC-like enzyme
MLQAQDLNKFIAMINILTSDRFLHHDTGSGHPERPERLNACIRGLQQIETPDVLNWREPRRARIDELQLVHPLSHIRNVRQTAERGGFSMDADTTVSPESYDVALQSAGAWLDGVDRLVHNQESSFVISRPPGHHAEADRAMGFCLFSNCAVAANYATQVKGVDRVAVLDWDVHHGNGTQHILESDPNMAYCSLHQWPFYPGTGAPHETGDHKNVLNIPMSAGSGKDEYFAAFDKQVMPFLKAFEPELLIISAGFDASINDPLGGMRLQAEHFAEFTKYCLDITPQLLLGLEGGYDLGDLSDCTKSVTEVLIENDSK